MAPLGSLRQHLNTCALSSALSPRAAVGIVTEVQPLVATVVIITSVPVPVPVRASWPPAAEELCPRLLLADSSLPSAAPSLPTWNVIISSVVSRPQQRCRGVMDGPRLLPAWSPAGPSGVLPLLLLVLRTPTPQFPSWIVNASEFLNMTLHLGELI